MVEPQLQSQPTPRRRPPNERVEAREFYWTTARGLVSIGVAIVCIVALVAAAMLVAFGPAAPLVTVPNVIGMSAADAKSQLEGKHLKLTVANYEYNPDVKEGSIISLSPYEGKLVRAGRNVRATVSKGGRNVKAPDLVGLTLETATEKLTALDLQVGTAPKQSSDKPDGTVLRQNPAADAVVERKAKINLALSGGPDFARLTTADGKVFVFRTLSFTVPQGKDEQMVSVTVEGGGEDKSVFERLCSPGEEIKVDFYGPEGARARVKLDDERVYSENL